MEWPLLTLSDRNAYAYTCLPHPDDRFENLHAV